MSQARSFTVKIFPHNIKVPESNTFTPYWDIYGHYLEKFINDMLDELESADDDIYNWEFKQVLGTNVVFQGKVTPARLVDQ